MVWALGLAASQPVGLRESFGSMNKSFNPGRAASNGIFAAVLASKNYTSSDGMIEAKRGWANTISTKQDYSEIIDGLGQRYEAALNTYKPFACGIVLHPAIDAAIQLRDENKLTADQIERVDLKVHPLVIELTGKKTPREGLEGKFSVYHAVAIALIEGRRREAIQQSCGQRSRRGCFTRQSESHHHARRRYGASRYDRCLERRTNFASLHCACDWQSRCADER
jgi:2-methylcitrate dehydratase PrpD